MSLISESSIASLTQIRKPIQSELAEFDRFFSTTMRSSVKLVELIARYIIRQKGKRVRPMLVLLSAQACGGITEATHRAAALVEILHTATLVHDDVVDDADTRRGIASINAVWKNKIAVLMGDYLLSRGLLLSLEYQEYDFLKTTSNAVKRMSEGELLQIQKSRQLDIDETTYIRIISDKTASLFATCTEIGAMSATEESDYRMALRNYGENVGIAFQIRDDLLDYQSRESIIGKPIGNDIREKKITLPLIFALKNSELKDVRKVIAFIKKGTSKKEVQWILEFVQKNGGIQYAKNQIMTFTEKAKGSLLSIPDSEAKTSLIQFVDYVASRNS